jgi:YggT family protein
MFVLANLISAVATVLDLVLNAYYWVVLIYAVMSWVSPDPGNPIVRFLHAVVDPFLDAIRRLLPFVVGSIDFSPFIGILIIFFTQRFVVGSLHDLAARLR